MQRNQTQIDLKSIRRAARERELAKKRLGIEFHSRKWGGIPNCRDARHSWKQLVRKEIL